MYSGTWHCRCATHCTLLLNECCLHIFMFVWYVQVSHTAVYSRIQQYQYSSLRCISVIACCIVYFVYYSKISCENPLYSRYCYCYCMIHKSGTALYILNTAVDISVPDLRNTAVYMIHIMNVGKMRSVTHRSRCCTQRGGVELDR